MGSIAGRTGYMFHGERVTMMLLDLDISRDEDGWSETTKEPGILRITSLLGVLMYFPSIRQPVFVWKWCTRKMRWDTPRSPKVKCRANLTCTQCRRWGCGLSPLHPFVFFSLDCPNMGTPQISKITTFTWGMMIFCTGLWGSLVVQKDAESHVYREFSVSWRVSSCSLSCAARPLEIDLHWQVQSVVATCCHPHQRKRAWFHPFVGNLGGYRSRFLSLRSEDVWITA